MITLAIDTCDLRGSIVLRSEGRPVAERRHEDKDYSSWLLPAVESLLEEAGKKLRDVELFAAATGPGSFTGVRVGLCAVKAWAEVYGTAVVGVSRLEATARLAKPSGLIAVTYDAHRGQIFGGLYERSKEETSLIGEEMVIAPVQFLAFVGERAGHDSVRWISLNPELVTGATGWESQIANGSTLQVIEVGVANSIGELAEEKAARGELTDVLSLDANYVRRSDAEIYWKGPAYRVG